MYQEFFIQKGVLVLPIVAMLSFVLSFVAILVWSLRTTQTPHYDALGQLPLDGSKVIAEAAGNGEGP